MPLKSHRTKRVQRLPDLCDSSPQDYKDKHKDSQLSKKDQVVRVTQPEELFKKTGLLAHLRVLPLDMVRVFNLTGSF